MKILIAAMLALSSAAHAQPVDFTKVIPAIEQQRNEALTRHALAEGRAAVLTEEVAKLQARVKELEAKLDKPADKKPAD